MLTHLSLSTKAFGRMRKIRSMRRSGAEELPRGNVAACNELHARHTTCHLSPGVQGRCRTFPGKFCRRVSSLQRSKENSWSPFQFGKPISSLPCNMSPHCKRSAAVVWPALAGSFGRQLSVDAPLNIANKWLGYFMGLLQDIF
jgi:hypothetical protein